MTQTPQKTVLVTGATRGIGKAIAEVFEGHDWKVIAPKRSEMELTSSDSVKRYLADLAGKSIAIDALINNAGENKINFLEKLPDEDWSRIFQVNLNSAFLLCRELVPTMSKRGWGRVVNLSTVYSGLARPGRAAYSASKAGLESLSRSVALEFGLSGVLANSVCPGFIDTDLTRQNNSPEVIQKLASQTALGRLGRVDEIARLVYFLGSDENTYLTGQSIVIDGGFSIQ